MDCQIRSESERDRSMEDQIFFSRLVFQNTFIEKIISGNFLLLKGYIFALLFDGVFTGFLTRKDVHIVSVNIYR